MAVAQDQGVGSARADGDGGLIALASATIDATATKTVPGNDNSFGPQYGTSFDFTLLFDHSMFTIVPTALLITACPLYIWFRRRDAVQVERGRLFWSKMVCNVYRPHITLFPSYLRMSVVRCICPLRRPGSTAHPLDHLRRRLRRPRLVNCLQRNVVLRCPLCRHDAKHRASTLCAAIHVTKY